jgi:hypothetical protein
LRRLLALLVLSCSVAFVAATPTPAPAPKLSAPAPSLPPPGPTLPNETPTVLIYPFDVSGDDQKIGIAIATILGQEMTAAGGISVLPLPQSVKRPDFLSYAIAQHADFYISGYVTPVGLSAAVVEQVVSVQSGVILFSQTAQVSSVADVASQSLQARSQILAFVGRGTQNIQTQTANTPAPTSTNGAQVKVSGISSIVDSVFHHHGAATPAPAAVAKPARGVIVAPVSATGTVQPTDLTNATNELYFAMNRRFNTSVTTVKSDVAKAADSICGTNRNNTIATGAVAPPTPKVKQTTFTLSIYTCFGVVLDSETGKGSNVKQAVDAAVAAYASAHPDNS